MTGRDDRFGFDDEASIGRALEQVAAAVRPPAPSIDIATAVRARIEQEHAAAAGRHQHRGRVLAVAASVAAVAFGATTLVSGGFGWSGGRSASSGSPGSVAAGVAAPEAPNAPNAAAPNAAASNAAGANSAPAASSRGGGAAVHTSLGAIRDRLGFTLLLPAELGLPDTVIDQSRPGEPRVVLVYRPADGAPGSAVQVVETSGADDYRNVADAALVRHDGFTGFWYQAPRVGTVEADGNGWLSGRPIQRWNTLLWQSSGVTMRIDSQLPLAAAIAVASSMTPAELERSLRNLS